MEANEKVAKMEAQIDSVFHELKELREEVKNLRDLTVSVREIALAVNAQQKELENVSQRLSTIETQPAETAKYYRRTVIVAVITAAISALVTMLVHSLI